jgi:hypothetical protein
VPHFEKMLYDNALLLRVYAHWARRTGDPLARRVSAETAEFLLSDLADGAFDELKSASLRFASGATLKLSVSGFSRLDGIVTLYSTSAAVPTLVLNQTTLSLGADASTAALTALRASPGLPVSQRIRDASLAVLAAGQSPRLPVSPSPSLLPMNWDQSTWDSGFWDQPSDYFSPPPKPKSKMKWIPTPEAMSSGSRGREPGKTTEKRNVHDNLGSPSNPKLVMNIALL